ncbi:MAG: PEP-CTERM-box response regulator transcription factor [Nitrospira sp.]
MSTPPTLLLVDDDAEIRDQMKWALASDYRLLEAVDQSTALAQVRETRPPVVLLDLGLPPDVDGASEGLSILRATLELHPTAKIIVITGNSDRSKALAAIEGGAYDFIEKPIQLDVLKVVLQRAIYRTEIERDQQECQEPVEEQEFEGIVGSSELMKTVFQSINQVGPTALPVLITGESGTGKELVAQAIHRRSTRKDHPFIAINCGAIPDTLLESELFGYERGAFTGAVQQKKGRIEYADGGTLFLDEIGDIPLSLQVKLLRFLQSHEVQRLGGNEVTRVDVRVLAATNIDLHKAISDGRFREDLYYRLCVIEIPVPPLSQRDADIALLARTFLLRFADEQRKQVKGFTPQAMDAVLAYEWPGNIRELENRIKRAVLMAEGRSITPANLGLQDPAVPESGTGTLKSSRARLERDMVRVVLEKHDGNVSRTATELGISRPTLYQLLARYGLKK